jgi:hypothetical protein
MLCALPARAREASPTAEQLVCTLSASVRILPVCLGRAREQWLVLSAHPSLAPCRHTNSERRARCGHGGLSLAEGCVYLAPG